VRAISPNSISFWTVPRYKVNVAVQESNAATAADAAHLAARFTATEIKSRKLPRVGEPLFGGPVRCEVELERSRHLIRYEEFCKGMANGEGRPFEFFETFIECAPPSYKDMAHRWWVYTRGIPARRVQVLLTRAQAMEGCEFWEKDADNEESRSAWKQQRESFAAEPDDSLFLFRNGEARMYPEASRHLGLW
jgi:hypothetical protein